MDMVTHKGSTIIGFTVDVEGPQSPLKASNKWPICPSEAFFQFGFYAFQLFVLRFTSKRNRCCVIIFKAYNVTVPIFNFF